MAWAICSTATATNPSAATSALGEPMAFANTSNRARAAAGSSGALPSAPNTGGKNRGSRRPSTRFASVTVAGPPRP